MILNPEQVNDNKCLQCCLQI